MMTSDQNDVKLGKETMTLYEFARWVSLFEAVELIANKCTDRGIDFDSPQGLKYIKPLDIQDYVNSRTDTMIMTITKSREFETQNAQLKIDGIRQYIYNFSNGDLGLPM